MPSDSNTTRGADIHDRAMIEAALKVLGLCSHLVTKRVADAAELLAMEKNDLDGRINAV